MRVAIIGAGGMLGQEILRQMPTAKSLTDLLLVDVMKCPPPNDLGCGVETLALDMREATAVTTVAAWRPDVVFHLAAMVSSGAEADFEGGYALNLHALIAFLEALRNVKRKPRFVFASSLAVYGPPYPEAVDESLAPRPASSYGTQKAMAELLLADYSRKNYLEAICMRLPTLVVRPGRPNMAASSFLSSIIREPLAGERAVLPVPRKTQVWIGSPQIAARAFWHAAFLNPTSERKNCLINLPGLSVSVTEMIEIASTYAARDLDALIDNIPDATIDAIVTSWPAMFNCAQAIELGFPKDASFHELLVNCIGSNALDGPSSEATGKR